MQFALGWEKNHKSHRKSAATNAHCSPPLLMGGRRKTGISGHILWPLTISAGVRVFRNNWFNIFYGNFFWICSYYNKIDHSKVIYQRFYNFTLPTLHMGMRLQLRVLWSKTCQCQWIYFSIFYQLPIKQVWVHNLVI